MVTNTSLNVQLRDNMNQTFPAIVTTKGDALGATAANALGRTAVGANGTTLVADSGEANGLNTAEVSMPASMIGLFKATCPAGWTEYTTARGRYIVGVPSGGSIGGTIGTPLTNLRNKTHTHTGPSHTHTVGSGRVQTPDTVDARVTNATSGGGGTGATGTAGAAGSILPYIQLTLCTKD